MVLRTSNGYPFTILDAVPALRTGIRVEIYDRDDPNTLIDLLPDTRNRRWVDPLNEPGAASFEIHEDDPRLDRHPGILRPGNIARFYLDNIPRFAMRIEARAYTPVSSSEHAGRWITVSGRGALGILEDGAIYPAGGLAGDPDRDTTGMTPGEAFRLFHTEAADRGSVVTVIATDFADDLDSSNQPYLFTIPEKARAGRDDLLRLIRRYAELGIDIDITHDLRLRMYANGLGVDRTIQTDFVAPVILRPAHNIADLQITEDMVIKNTLIVETPAGFFERSHSGSVTTHLRREGYLSVGNTTDGDYVDRATDAAFAALAEIRAALTVEVLDIDGHRPYADWGKGDWVFAPNADGELTRYRVRGLTVTEDPEGNPIFVPTINSVDAEIEDRLQRWMRTMTPGTVGGAASDVASPNTTTTAESAAAADEAVAEHEAGFPHVDELDDLFDVETGGVVDRDTLIYDNADGKWKPARHNLTELEDTSLPGAAEGDMVYRSDAGLWVVVAGTKTSGRVPTIQGDGSVAWQTPAGGGGNGLSWGDLILPGNAPGGPEDDEFNGDTIDGAWTQQTVSGNAAWSEGGDVLSVIYEGQSSGHAAAILKEIPGTPTPPLEIRTAIRLAGVGNHQVVGPIFTDGTGPSASQVHSRINNADGGVILNGGALNNLQASILRNAGTLQLRTSWLHMRLVWVAANTWRLGVSLDGINWTALAQADASHTLSPTHYGLFVSRFGSSSGNPAQAAFEFFRVVM